MRATRLAAVVVVAALGGGVAMLARSPTETHAPHGPSPTVTSSTGQARETSLFRPSTTTIGGSVTVEGRARRSRLDVAAEGMSAWGRFAVSGDLGEVDPWFAVGGPQYARFEQEASDLAADPLGDPPYAVAVEGAELSGGKEEARVTARVVFVRTGEPSQSFRWVIVLRREAGEWRIWTVADQADSKGEAGASGNSVPQN